MSCRATKGNSAVTSLTRFQTGLDERTVSREFHAARRDAARRLYPHGKDPEPAPNVLAHLAAMREIINNDNTLKARHKASLLQRVHQAEESVREGNDIPNRETFTAWQSLPDYARAAARAAARASTSTTEVTADDVAAAETAVETAKRALVESGSRRGRAIAAVRSANERLTRAQAAYDTTPRGFTNLRHLFRTRGAVDPGIAARWRAANERLQRDIAATHRPTFDRSLETLAERARTFRAEAVRAIAEHRENPTNENFERAANAHRQHVEARESYLDSLALRVPLPPVRNPDAAYSMQAWAATTHETLPRAELWAAAEHALAAADRLRYTDGIVDETEVARLAHRRAAARQAVLDTEGRNEIDPINPTFAASVRRKRQFQGRGGGTVDPT